MTLRLTEADAGRGVLLHVGDDLVLQLAENPTTGYAWSVEAPSAAGAALREAPARFQAPAGPEAGAAGAREFRFEAVAPGAADLQFKLWRDWAGEASVTKRVTLRVQVR